ncbi:hypothetical protein Tco_1165081 [Tanacetum coccineum]
MDAHSYGLRSEDPNQYLKDFLKLMDLLDLDGDNKERTRLGKLCDLDAEESWALLEDLTLYDNEGWNDPRDFAKPVKAIALPQDAPMVLMTLSIAWKIRTSFVDTIIALPIKREVYIDEEEAWKIFRMFIDDSWRDDLTSSSRDIGDNVQLNVGLRKPAFVCIAVDMSRKT